MGDDDDDDWAKRTVRAPLQFYERLLLFSVPAAGLVGDNATMKVVPRHSQHNNFYIVIGISVGDLFVVVLFHSVFFLCRFYFDVRSGNC